MDKTKRNPNLQQQWEVTKRKEKFENTNKRMTGMCFFCLHVSHAKHSNWNIDSKSTMHVTVIESSQSLTQPKGLDAQFIL